MSLRTARGLGEGEVPLGPRGWMKSSRVKMFKTCLWVLWGGLCFLNWRCGTLSVILFRSGSFWQLRWHWFRCTKSRTYAYATISQQYRIWLQNVELSLKNTNDVTSGFDQRSILFTLHFYFLSSKSMTPQNQRNMLLELSLHTTGSTSINNQQSKSSPDVKTTKKHLISLLNTLTVSNTCVQELQQNSGVQFRHGEPIEGSWACQKSSAYGWWLPE